MFFDRITVNSKRMKANKSTFLILILSGALLLGCKRKRDADAAARTAGGRSDDERYSDMDGLRRPDLRKIGHHDTGARKRIFARNLFQRRDIRTQGRLALRDRTCPLRRANGSAAGLGQPGRSGTDQCPAELRTRETARNHQRCQQKATQTPPSRGYRQPRRL